MSVGPAGAGIFSDNSTHLLMRCQDLAAEAGFAGRCRFVEAPASDLSVIKSASVDAVTLRAVLIYADDNASAFAEFHRVLGPGGRLSLSEPINRFALTEPPERFDGRDLVALAELTGFGEIHLTPAGRHRSPGADAVEGRLPPRTQSLDESMKAVLSSEEAEQLSAQLRPQVEQGPGQRRAAAAYLWAVPSPS